MALTIENRTVRRIALVDDEKSVRDNYEMSIEDLHLQALSLIHI